MNISLFYLNLESIQDLLKDNDIVGQYSQVIPLITAYRTTPDEASKEVLDKAIEDIDVSLQNIVHGLSVLPHSNLMVRELQAEHILGLNLEPFKKIIYDDLFTAHDRVQQLASDTQAFRTTISNLVTNLSTFNYISDSAYTDNLFTIEFSGETEVKKLGDIEENIKKLKYILFNYACLSSDAAENAPQIHSISKDSPVSVDITWLVDNLPNILTLIGFTVIFYLNKKKDTLKYKEFEQLVITGVPEDKVPENLRKGFEELNNPEITEKELKAHVKELVEAVKSKPKDRTAKEQKTYLTKGAHDLLELLSKGARVEVYKEEVEDQSTDGTDVRVDIPTIIFTSYKEIEHKQSMLSTNVSIKIPKSTDENDS